MNKQKIMSFLFFLTRFLFIFSLPLFCLADENSKNRIKTLYNSLDPTSISQHLAFYELYPHYSIGQQALKDAWKLLAGVSIHEHQLLNSEMHLFSSAIDSLISLINKPMSQEPSPIDEETKKVLLELSKRLHHNSLRGHHIWSEQEVLALPIQEIDLARGLFLSQFGADRARIQSYEALIDLMSLQILARLPENALPEDKIIAINHFIFEEMGFRFPPHSLYAKDIDLYTFLPSVLDSRRGVCLGVSILYLCLAQRLNLSLEMITPPGHIYVRYRSGNKEINIETTARGVHIDSEEYLSISTRSLQKRTIREVIGMTHFNQASVYWQNREYEKALYAYQKAEPYMQEDPLLKELMGYILLLTGNQERGEKLIEEIKDILPDYAVTKNTMAEDYLNGKIDAEGISVIFTKVDEDRKSILAKKQLLEETLKRYPYFRSGILSLAVTWLQLHRAGEALDILQNFVRWDKSDPEVHYYLSVLYAQRRAYSKAWYHLQQSEAILKEYQHYPKTLKELRRELLNCCPE